MGVQRRRYDRQFKLDLRCKGVRSESNRPVTAVARDLGAHPNALYSGVIIFTLTEEDLITNYLS